MKQKRKVLSGGRARVIRKHQPILDHYVASDECCKFSHLPVDHPDRPSLLETTVRIRNSMDGENKNSMAMQSSTWNHFQRWCEEGEHPPRADLHTAVDFLDYEASYGRYATTDSKNKGSNFGNLVRHMQYLADIQGWLPAGVQLKDQPRVKYPGKAVRQHAKALVHRLDKDTGATAIEDSKVLTREEEAALHEESWKHANGRIGLRQIALHRLCCAAGNRGGEICCMRLEQLRMADVSGLKRPGGGMKYHGDDINCLRWMSQQKASNIYETARGMTRAAEPSTCPISALALYLSYNIDVDPVIDPFGEMVAGEVVEAYDEGQKLWVQVPAWATTHLFFGRQVDQGLSRAAMQQGLNQPLAAIGVKEDKTACMHLFRYTNVRRKLDLGMDREAIYREWASSVGPTVYGQVEIPWDNHFGGVGWSDWQNLHFLGRSWATWEWIQDNHPDIAAFILPRLFKGTEEAQRALDQLGVGKSSSRNFVAICRWLRTVFLQDAVFHIRTRSSHPVYSNHPLFRDARFLNWFHIVWSPYVMQQHRRGLEEIRRHDQMPRDMIEEVVGLAVGGAGASQVDQAVRRLSDHFSPPKSKLPEKVFLRFHHKLSLEEMYRQYSEGSPGQRPLAEYLNEKGDLVKNSKVQWLDTNTRRRWWERKAVILKIRSMDGSREAIKAVQALVDDKYDGNIINAAKDMA